MWEKLWKNWCIIKDIKFRDIKTRFEEEDGHYKPRRNGNVWNNNSIKYESKGNKNEDLSGKEVRYYNQSSKIWHVESSINNCI